MLQNLIIALSALLGVISLNTMIVNLWKNSKWAKDDTGLTAHALLDILELACLWAIGAFGLNVDIHAIDAIAGMIADVGAIILPFLFPAMVGGGAVVHSWIRGLPWVGTSFSQKAQG